MSTLIGKSIAELPTPNMVVDSITLQANLDSLAGFFANRPAKLRPHFKSHKCVTLAHRQMAAGHCVGITAAKLSEAEALVNGGIFDVLIANQVIGPGKAERLAALNSRAQVRVSVDDVGNAQDIGAAATKLGVTVGVLIEVDVGMERCGVKPGPPALHFARKIMKIPGLRLDGLQGFEGHIVLHPDQAELRKMVKESMQPLLDTRQRILDDGLPCAIVSGGGTGTYDMTGDLPGMDEIQAGSYALMDCHYKTRRPEFHCARWVEATVISAHGDVATADVGLKGLGNEFALPQIKRHPDAKVRYVAEEHTVIDNLPAKVGDRLRIIPAHGCTTNNLYRRLYVARDEMIIDIWPIEGSGCLE